MADRLPELQIGSRAQRELYENPIADWSILEKCTCTLQELGTTVLIGLGWNYKLEHQLYSRLNDNNENTDI